MKKYLAILIAAVFLLAFSIPKETSAAIPAGSFSAFEASKMVFNEHFVSHSHPRTDLVHSESHYAKLAIDIQFLSTYTYQAKNKNDSTYSTALTQLNLALDTLYSDVYAKSSNYAANVFQDPGAANILIASILVKKFNMSDLTSTRQTKVNYLYNNTKSWLKTAYNTQKVNGTTYTFRQVVENKYKNANEDALFALNIIAMYGGALALDSDFLFKQYGVNTPDQYTDRPTIANIGNYVKAVNFGDYTKGKLANVGSSRNWVQAGYVSWHAKALALMAHGTVYTQYFSQRPGSTFMTEAEAITTGLKTVHKNTNKIPQEFYQFGTGAERELSENKSEWLYSLAWTGNQADLSWIDKINQSGATNNKPVIVHAAGKNQQALHRSLEGLTGAMLKGLYFNPPIN
ncbi:hypothetical protein SFC08_01900 [Lysinibacillus halotolerans]